MLLLGQHSFAVERLRYTNATHKLVVPVHLRICRHCRIAIETPEHALLQCVFDRKTALLRNSFREDVFTKTKLMIPVSLSDDEALSWLKDLIFHWNLVPLTAKFIFRYSGVWNDTLLHRLPGLTQVSTPRVPGQAAS